jgi:hypothetical protein
VIVLISIAYFMALEIKQIIDKKLDWLKDYWNWLDISSWTLNIAFIICDLTETDP